MSKLRSKGFIQKTIIVLVILILFNFIFPIYSSAKWWGGGTLFTPISELACGISDVLIEILQEFLLPGAPEAIEYMSMAGWTAQQYINSKATFDGVLTGLADTLANKTWILGDATVAIANWIGNNFSDMEQDEIENFYEEKVITAILYSPYSIFANKIPALDVNFINPTAYYSGGDITITMDYTEEGTPFLNTTYVQNEIPENEDQKYKSNTAYQLRDTISTWYVALRNIAVVGLLSVLVYVAIRIIMSSTAGETAKYKSMLKDWLVAMCILVFMHYMMAFLLKSSEMLIDLFDNGSLTNSNGTSLVIKSDQFMTEAREMAQSAQDEDGDGDLGRQFGYTLVYCILVFYTVIFTWRYLKRFIYLAFLTIVSPLVALTYPIDKLKDGKAQAFDMWFKEYVFNVLIQPIHLLLYTILITSAASFAQENMIYTVIALGFMLEAEKIVKSMFGFNKGEGGLFSSALTGGAIFGAVASLMKSGAKKLPRGGSKEKGGSSGGGSGGSSGEGDNGRVRFNERTADSDATRDLDAFRPGSSGGARRREKYETGMFKGLNKGYDKIGTKVKGAINGAKGVVGGVKDSVLSTAPFRLARDIGKSPVGKTIKGVARVGGRFINKDNAKKAIRLAAMGAGATALGTLGLAGGIASDKDEDILKYAGLGLGTGALLGNSAYDAAAAAGKIPGSIKDTFQRGYHGPEYQDKVLNPKLDKEWKKNEDVINYYKRKYGDDYRKRMEDALELRKAGITDQKEIDAAIKLTQKNSDVDIHKAANVMQEFKDITQKDLLDPEIAGELEKSLTDRTDAATAARLMDLGRQVRKLK